MPGPESTSPIRLDESRALIVIVCDDHEWYHSARFYRDEAYDAACAHEEAEHPGDERQRHARRERRRVAAAKQAASCGVGEKV